jgi:hypothetical protein
VVNKAHIFSSALLKILVVLWLFEHDVGAFFSFFEVGSDTW